jgi:NADPH-dependent glutamate synthase beta subunit-like oxidoreductase
MSQGVLKKVPNTEKEIPADLVIIAMGFVSPELTIQSQLGIESDQRNNIHAEYGDYRTSLEGVFAAGDCRRGQSLVVWAINEGRGVAEKCHEYLEIKNSIKNSDDLYFV